MSAWHIMCIGAVRCKITIFVVDTLIHMNKTSISTRTPAMLVALCVLSIVAVVATSVFDLMLIVVNQYSPSQMREMTAAMGQEVETEQLDIVFSMAGYAVYHLIFNLVELAGVILLLTRRGVGFHVYAASQIGLCWVAAVGFESTLMQTIFLSFIWIVAYYLATRRMLSNANSEDQS